MEEALCSVGFVGWQEGCFRVSAGLVFVKVFEVVMLLGVCEHARKLFFLCSFSVFQGSVPACVLSRLFIFLCLPQTRLTCV